VVRDANQVAVGELILARLARGKLRCRVEELMTDLGLKAGSNPL